MQEQKEDFESRKQYARDGYKLFQKMGYNQTLLLQLLNAVDAHSKESILGCITEPYITCGLDISRLFLSDFTKEEDIENMRIFMVGLSGTDIDEEDDVNNTYNNYMTVSEVASELRYDEETIRRRIKAGDIKATKNGKAYRIKREDFEEFIKSL